MKQTARFAIALIAVFLLSLSKATLAQKEVADAPDPVARGADIYCTGFISEAPPRIDLQIVGGEQDNLISFFAQGDIVYLNKGRESGVSSGAVFYIIRPLGEMKHPFTKKKLGYFVRELGLLRVVEVYDKVSTAEIIVSCDTIEAGDVLRPYEENLGPDARDPRPLPRYGEGSGGIRGQIIMSRGFREYLAANEIVYIDIGSRQGVRPGDYFTIYRNVGRREGVTKIPLDNIIQERSGGFSSERFRGGDFSTEAARVPRSEVLRKRPPIPRKVMGEMIVLKVQNTAAVGLITRTTSEVNIGDYIEPAN